jgi:HD-GYP domain-containing protein (c-di-GMP phosphodiesterase class II)
MSQSKEILSTDASKEKLLALYRIGQELVSVGDLQTLLKHIMTAIKEVFHVEGSSVLLVDEEKKELYFKEVTGEIGEIIKQIRIPLHEKSSIAAWCAVHRKSMIVNDVEQDSRHNKAVDKAVGFQTRSILASPVIWQERVLGVLEAVNKKDGAFTFEDEILLNLFANQVAVALNTTRLIEDLRNFFVHSVEIWIQLLDEIFPSLKGHASRVARMAAAMGREIGLNPKEYEDLFYAAYLHDIGKLRLAVPTLDDTTHPEIAYKMLEPIRMFKDILPLILHHHERWDGTGFPKKLKGEAIPMGARILAIAEDFDEQGSLVHGALAQKKFYEEFLASFGTKYDPSLLEAFKKASHFLMSR